MYSTPTPDMRVKKKINIALDEMEKADITYTQKKSKCVSNDQQVKISSDDLPNRICP